MAQSTDELVTDYSGIITNEVQAYAFCKLYVEIAQDALIASTTTNLSLINAFDCEQLKNTPGDPVSSSNYNSAKSIEFFQQMKWVYPDSSTYNTGFQTSEMVCVPDAQIAYVGAAGSENCSPALTDQTYVCHHEILDIIQFLANQDWATIVDG